MQLEDPRDRLIKELQAIIAKQQEEIKGNRQALEKANAQIAELEEKLRTNSDNSSKPPSTDPPFKNKTNKDTLKNKRKRERKARRKRGAQKGHAAHHRQLLPEDEVDNFIDCKPDKNCLCGGHITIDDEIAPERQQKFNFPKIKPIVTEFRLFAGVCNSCGKRHRALLPKGIPYGILLPRAMAMVSLLSSKYRLSKRLIEQMLEDFFGLSLSLGSISNTESTVSEALSEPVKEAKTYIKKQPLVHGDETSHKLAGKIGWMWVFTTSLVCVFSIDIHRTAAVAKRLLGETFKGILVSDRYSAYNWISTKRRQVCWSHLIRDFVKISERSGKSRAIGNELVYISKRKIFHYWHQVGDGTISHARFQKIMIPIRKQIEALLRKGMSCGHAKTARTCHRILKVRSALWRFVDTEGIEPTNNFAERMLRSFVIWRKVSFGTQSERGNRFVERMMTVNMTCQLQSRNTLDYVTGVIESHLKGERADPLLPREAC